MDVDDKALSPKGVKQHQQQNDEMRMGGNYYGGNDDDTAAKDAHQLSKLNDGAGDEGNAGDAKDGPMDAEEAELKASSHARIFHHFYMLASLNHRNVTLGSSAPLLVFDSIFHCLPLWTNG